MSLQKTALQALMLTLQPWPARTVSLLAQHVQCLLIIALLVILLISITTISAYSPALMECTRTPHTVLTVLPLVVPVLMLHTANRVPPTICRQDNVYRLKTAQAEHTQMMLK